MSDNPTPPADNIKKNNSKKSWLERIIHTITGEPQTKEELVEVLRDGADRELLDDHSLIMLERVLDVQTLRVKEVMIPRSKMVTIEKSMGLKEIVDTVVKSGHSRFPIIGENRDKVNGILLAKDLLNFAFSDDKSFNIKDVMRNVEFIPESKRLDILLQDFRNKRNHIAIVVDEYGGVTGLITIEDVIEQIVGDIADEHDVVESPNIQKKADGTFSLKALTTLEEFNEYFDTELESKEVETIGGLLMKNFGHLPKNGETINLNGFIFKVVRADRRRIYLLDLIVLGTDN